MQDNQNSRVEEARFVSPSDLSVNFTKKQMVFLGLQNTVAMSGVIIVPILCGLNVSVTLFCAGIGTLIYQFIDKGIVPAFLGGSFAFIAPLTMIITDMGIPYAQGGTHRYCCGLASKRFASSSTGPNSMHLAWQWNTQEGSLPFSWRSAHKSQIFVNAGMKS